jgi:hypothetical protein
MENEEKKLTAAVNVKQNYVAMSVPGVIIQIFTSNLVAFFMHIHNVQLIM